MENQNKNLLLIEELGNMSFNDKSKRTYKMGLFKCFCGKEFKCRVTDVKNGNTKSCGCVRKNRKHGKWNHKLYGIWLGMMQRCNNPKHIAYKRYGGRGITICDEWHNVENFINDMYPSYIEGLTLDRIDNNLGYYKDNCRWATIKEQSQNKRKIVSSSGFLGVCYFKNTNKWKASVNINKKSIHIGYFFDKVEAAKAYDKYVLDNQLDKDINFLY